MANKSIVGVTVKTLVQCSIPESAMAVKAAEFFGKGAVARLEADGSFKAWRKVNGAWKVLGSVRFHEAK